MTVMPIEAGPGPDTLLLQPALARPTRRSGLRNRITEQVVMLSIRPEPLAVLMLLFLVWLVLQALKLAGRTL
jgi:hypothetical protein